MIIGKLADAIYEGHHGQVPESGDYPDYDGAEDFEDEESGYTDSSSEGEEEAGA